MPSSLRRLLEKLKISTKKKGRQRSKKTDVKERDEELRRCFLMELPTELLLEIVSYLTAVPETCLALTCKRMFAISEAVLGSKTLQFNRDFARLFHHYRDRESFATSRWQLLNILEDSKWRACSKCLKLHPRDSFSSRELKRKPEARTCKLGHLAGIVDLCPCKKITFRDKMDLVDILQEQRKSMAAPMDPVFGSEKSEPYCWHSCTEKYGSAELKIQIFPELDVEDRLLVRTEYQLSMGPGQLGKEEHMTPRFGCAHRSMDLWLASVCQTTICQLHESFCIPCKRIFVCSYCNTTLRCAPRRPCHSQDSGRVTYLFCTQRCLGGLTPVPDKTWAAQRIHPAGPIAGLHTSSDLCPWTLREHPPLSWPPSLGMQILYPAMNDESLLQLYYSIHMM